MLLARATRRGNKAIYDESCIGMLEEIRAFLLKNGWQVDKWWKHHKEYLLNGREIIGAIQDFVEAKWPATGKLSDDGCLCRINISCWDGYAGEWKLEADWSYDFQAHIDAVIATWPKSLRGRCVDAEDYGGICFGSDGGSGHAKVDFTWSDIKWAALELPKLATMACKDMNRRLKL